MIASWHLWGWTALARIRPGCPVFRDTPGREKEFKKFFGSRAKKMSLDEFVNQVKGTELPLPPLGLNLPKISEIIANEPPPRDYLLSGVLPARIVGGLIATGGTGKGFFLLKFGLSLATGRKFGPLEPIKKFKVLYLAGEDSQEELGRRVYATVKALWPDRPPPPEVDNFDLPSKN
jgi:hypothetical protein